jgi:hypothetical protein
METNTCANNYTLAHKRTTTTTATGIIADTVSNHKTPHTNGLPTLPYSLIGSIFVIKNSSNRNEPLTQSSKKKRWQKHTTAGNSPVVTHLTTNPPVSHLTNAERTGIGVLEILWSYVSVMEDVQAYNHTDFALRKHYRV